MQIETVIKNVKSNWIAYIIYDKTRIWSDIRDFDNLDELLISLSNQMIKFQFKTQFYARK